MPMTEFAGELHANLTQNILPYWLDNMTDPRGGFYGRRDGSDLLDTDAPKGCILNARILWTFSAAYRELGDKRYLEAATRAFEYIKAHFVDREFGGCYWSLGCDGEPLDTKKQFYAIAFVVYGLAEYFRATGSEEALDLAIDLFDCIEAHSRDRGLGGYFEAATRDWHPIADMRLSEHDANSSKTMNTHLHILEGHTNLLRALRESGKHPETAARVEEAVRHLLDVFLHRIENPRTHHLTLFFDDNWHKLDDAESYGHDIEASWLLLESALVVGDPELIRETRDHTYHIGMAGLQGRCTDGSMVYERHASGRYDNDKHWWVQAEAVVGQLWLAQYHDKPEYVEKARETWRYIADHIVDPAGEWHWSRRSDGSINRTDDKAGFWKCPYHNSRMVLESLRSLGSLQR